MTTATDSAYQVLDLARLHESPLNPRRTFDPAKPQELADSIKAKGIITPLLVRPNAKGYEIADHNCVYRRVVDTHPALCDWHLSLLGRLLGKEVECSQFISQGADSCRFVVKDDSANGN